MLILIFPLINGCKKRERKNTVERIKNGLRRKTEKVIE